MNDDDTRRFRRQRGESLRQPGKLAFVDPAVLEGRRPRRVDARNGDFGVCIKGLEVVGDDPSIPGERTQEAAEDVVQGYVVIARHDDRGRRQRIEEPACLRELPDPGALGEVARDDDQIGSGLPHGGLEAGANGLIDRAEMQVGKMDDRFHGAVPSCATGASTRSAAGRLR